MGGMVGESLIFLQVWWVCVCVWIYVNLLFYLLLIQRYAALLHIREREKTNQKRNIKVPTNHKSKFDYTKLFYISCISCKLKPVISTNSCKMKSENQMHHTQHWCLRHQMELQDHKYICDPAAPIQTHMFHLALRYYHNLLEKLLLEI